MSGNGKKPDLDFTEFLDQRITVKIRDYEFSVAADVPTPFFVRLVRALSVLGEAMQGNEERTPEQVEAADAEVWTLLEEVMRTAEPAPPRPLKQLFTSSTALRTLGFLATKFGAVTNSTGSSRSLPSTTAPSA
jgi:hypothetical protein